MKIIYVKNKSIIYKTMENIKYFFDQDSVQIINKLLLD